MKAVILAGGLGKRLRPLTEDKPKVLVEVCGKPIIEWQIEWLKGYGITEFIILAGYSKEKLIEHLGSGRRFGVKISYVVEEEPLGTGGAIKNGEHILSREDVFIVVNGDIITNLDPLIMVKALKNDPKAVGCIALTPMRSPYGIVRTENGYIASFLEKPVLEDYMINAGVYALRPTIFEYLPEKGDIEVVTFPRLARERRLLGHVYRDIMWKSIDTVKDIEETSQLIEASYKVKCNK